MRAQRLIQRSLLLSILVCAFPGGAFADTGTFSTLYTFTGDPDGSGPYTSLIIDNAGNLYGTTIAGGTSNEGTVFKLSSAGTLTRYSFLGGSNGYYPIRNIAIDASGNIYGTTENGGTDSVGALFEWEPNGTLNILHSFTGGTDGEDPLGGVISDGAGNLYGTTYVGQYEGPSADGVIFKLDSTGAFTTLYTFTGGADGADPFDAPTIDSAGNLYGTTALGGTYGCGVVFKLSASGTLTTLYTFTCGADGANPVASVILDSTGNLYGTTDAGGSVGFGTVFKLSPTGTLTTLYTFASEGSNGKFPEGTLVRDGAGNLYGITRAGGASDYGTVFELNPSGTLTTLHAFSGGADGASPIVGLTLDPAGNLYGVAGGGGTTPSGNTGNGVIFEITGVAAASAPAPPIGLTATAGNAQVTLNWTGSNGATSYNVYEGTTPGGESMTPVAMGVTGTNFTITGLTNGTIYYFFVEADDSVGSSAASLEVSSASMPVAVPALPLWASLSLGLLFIGTAQAKSHQGRRR